MHLGMQLRQYQALECVLCELYYDSEMVLDTSILSHLCGSKRYAVCIVCGQDVGEKMMEDPEYQRKWDAIKLKVVFASLFGVKVVY